LLSPEKIEALRKSWEDQLNEIEGRHRDALMAARDMLASLAENLRISDGEEPSQIMEAIEHRMLALEEEADENFEMVQLGLAVAIINHEFSAAIKNVRQNVRELGDVSRKSAVLRPLYLSIRANFEHLDGHLKLFTPLQRRLYRSAHEISGKSIRKYVTDLFGSRIERHQISLDYSPAFLTATVECYPSTLYPAFINLVDNALFWLGNSKTERKIWFDVSGTDLIVSNTGPAIEERDRLRIFERGFSRRPGGRGLGLFISSRALEAENMHLFLGEPQQGFSIAFHISAPTLKLHV
jgi:signal transduction histidine kinase